MTASPDSGGEPMKQGAGSSSRRKSAAFFIIVAIVSCATSFAGLRENLPLDSHEVFVARTAEEMLARGDWLVPYFNDAPRLRKPPLAYWIAMGIDRIGTNDGVISELEARITPALSAVLLALGVFCLGRRVVDAEVGLVAGLLAAASSGFVTYSHSARPEMLYAALCTWAMVGFLHALKCAEPGGSRTGILTGTWFAWLMIGLALLAKGPQLPLLLVVGFIFGMIATGRRASVLRVVRPFTGLVIALAVAGWWYIAILVTMPEAKDVWLFETVNRYTAWTSKWNYLDPYYLYRTAGLILPWVMLYPFALAAPWLRELKGNPQARLMWWLLIVPLVALHVSLGRRWYYMVPAMGPLLVLMAGFITIKCRATERSRQGVVTVVALVVILLMIGGILWLHFAGPEVARPSVASVVAVLVVAVAAMLTVGLWYRRPSLPRSMILYPPLAATVVFFFAAAHSNSLWRAKRFDRRAFSMEVFENIPPEASLFGWKDHWMMEQYYGHRPIPTFKNERALASAFPPATESYLLIEEDEATSFKLPRTLNIKPVLRHEELGGDDVLLLWRLSRAASNRRD